MKRYITNRIINKRRKAQDGLVIPGAPNNVPTKYLLNSIGEFGASTNKQNVNFPQGNAAGTLALPPEQEVNTPMANTVVDPTAVAESKTALANPPLATGDPKEAPQVQPQATGLTGPTSSTGPGSGMGSAFAEEQAIASEFGPKSGAAAAEVASDLGTSGGETSGGGSSTASGVAAGAQAAEMVGGAIASTSDSTKYTMDGKERGGKALAGAGKGAAMGATLGTAVFPVVGTAVGAAVGAVVGAGASLISTGAEKKKREALGYQDRSNSMAKAVGQQRILMSGRTVGANTGFNTGAGTAGSNAYLPGQAASGYAAKLGSYRGLSNGGEVHPGGVEQPIGWGATKFKGNKHDQSGMGSDSGIILEEGGKGQEGLEVEDGELSVQTVDNREYIVSDHIKNPDTGNTLAEDLEKELKEMTNQSDADAVVNRYVQMNERLKAQKERGRAQSGEYSERGRADESYQNQAPLESGLFGEQTMDGVAQTQKANPWFDWENFNPSNSEDVTKFQKGYNGRVDDVSAQVTEDGKWGSQTASVYIPGQPAAISPTPGNIPNPVDKSLKESTIDLSNAQLPKTEQTDPPYKAPTTFTGTGLQAAGPAYALGNNLSPSHMSPSYIKSGLLGRVSLNQERAQESASHQSLMAGAKGSLAGPAAAALGQQSAAQTAQRQGQISSAESRTNVGLANQEAGMQLQADSRNQSAFMNASQVNAGIDNTTNQYNLDKNIGAVNQLGRIGSQTVKDYNNQYADRWQNQATQVDGEFDRGMQNYYRGTFDRLRGKGSNVNPEGGTTMNQEQIDNYYAQNKPEEGTAKRGGYITKYGKIRK